jgi:hypothetical protein
MRTATERVGDPERLDSSQVRRSLDSIIRPNRSGSPSA